MIELTTLPLHTTLPLSFIGGLMLGYVFFRTLRLTADLIVNQGHPLLALALTLCRFALITAGLYVAALAGGFALLAALAGVLCAKTLMLRQLRGTAI